MRDAETDFEEFVAARGPRLLRVAWLLTGDTHLAEDLLQTVLAKVWPKWRGIAAENPEAYVRRALVNTASSWWQRRWRGEVPHGEVPDTVTAVADPFASVDLEQSLAVLIRRLPARQRAVVVLRYFEDLSVEETAEVLGCRPGTVKSQAAKALAMLRGRSRRCRAWRRVVSGVDEEPEPEEEWELSVLLERAVPQPTAPHDRMAQIRRRVRRRRRRRVAAGALAAVGGVTAAAVVAAALLQPAGPVTPRGQQVLPAASPSRAVPAPGSPCRRRRGARTPATRWSAWTSCPG